MEDDASSLDPFLVIPDIPAWVRFLFKTPHSFRNNYLCVEEDQCKTLANKDFSPLKKVFEKPDFVGPTFSKSDFERYCPLRRGWLKGVTEQVHQIPNP
jgi:hypothetical protein